MSKLYDLLNAMIGKINSAPKNWNDLKSKPVEMVGSDTLTWDGNTEGLESVPIYFDDDILFAHMYRVTDSIPTPSDMPSDLSKVTYTDQMGEVYPIDAEISVIDEDGLIMLGLDAFIIPTDNYTLEDITFPLKGCYFIKGEEGWYTSALTIPGYTGFNAQEKIAASHLYQPDWDQSDESKPDFVKNKPFGEQTVAGDTLVWDGNAEGKTILDVQGNVFYHISSVTPAKSDFVNGGTVSFFEGGTTVSESFAYEDVSGQILDDGFASLGLIMVVPVDGYDVGSQIGLDSGVFIASKAGVYFNGAPADGFYVVSLTIPGYTGFTRTEVKTIDTKYLPEHLQIKSDVLVDITWDGNTEGLAMTEIFGFPAYKVADEAANYDDLMRGCSLKAEVDGKIEEYHVSSLEAAEYVIPISDTVIIICDMILIVNSDMDIEGYVVEKGVYFPMIEDVMTVCEFKIEEVTALDAKYIPPLNQYATATNPVVYGAFSQNRKEDSEIGNFSHAEGYYTTASVDCSHAEGYYTTASGNNSHAEGSETTASGANSHAEGYYTTASGANSHAEGYGTIAKGIQHVHGAFNVEDPCDEDRIIGNLGGVNNRYIHIVGNGEYINTRSNAHTLDWDGNAWFAGGIELTSPNGTRYRFTVSDDGALSSKVVTE